VNTNTRQKWLGRKRGIQRRLRVRKFRPQRKPVPAARNIHYDMADRTRAIGCGAIGAIHLLARKIDLIDLIDRQVQLLRSTSRITSRITGSILWILLIDVCSFLERLRPLFSEGTGLPLPFRLAGAASTTGYTLVILSVVIWVKRAGRSQFQRTKDQ
jgi:hypothetical protein